MKNSSVVVSGLFFSVMFCVCQPPGLPNQGNTCFMNAFVQATYNMPSFIKNFQKISKYFDVNTLSLLYWYSKVIAEMKKGNVSQKNLIELSKASAKALGSQPGQQHDASEILQKFLGGLQEELKGIEQKIDKAPGPTFMGEKKSDVASKLRAGWEQTGIELLRAVPSGVVLEEENALYMPILSKRPLHLYDFLDSFFALEKLEGGKEGKFSIRSTSDYLILCLRRTGYGKRAYRINYSVTIPFDLDLRSYMNPLIVNGAKKDGTYDSLSKRCTYELIAVVYQFGSAKGGHYQAFIKDQWKGDGSWYNCNDSVVRKTTPKDMQDAIDSGGYVFVYRRMKEDDAKKFLERRDEHERERRLRKDLNDLAQSLYELAKPE